LDSGVGLPAMTTWARKQRNDVTQAVKQSGLNLSKIAGDMDLNTVRSTIAASEFAHKTKHEQKQLRKELDAELRGNLLRSMWKTTVLDITNTIHETTQMVLFDQSVPRDTRRKRAEGLEILGDILSRQKRPPGPNFAADGQLAYEEVAFSAMLETCVRKEQQVCGAPYDDEYETEFDTADK
jgi:X-domain of DnaJ-containing